MTKATLMAALALVSMATSAVHAADAVGTLSAVSGPVMVTGADKVVVRAKAGMPLTQGASVVVSSQGKATVSLNNGCVIPLQPSQHLVVNAQIKCAEVQASIKNLLPAYKSAQTGVAEAIVLESSTAAATTTAITTTAVVGGVAATVGVLAVVNQVTKDDGPSGN